MKKIALFGVLITFILHIQLKGQVLNVPEVTQEQNQWCWAGVSACALDYYCTPTPQCVIAEYTRTVATWHSFGTTDCCVNANVGCNYWNYNWGSAGSIQDILIHFANIYNDGVGSSLSIPTITSNIQLNRVFIIRWGWTTGGGHFVVGHGISGNNIYYMDPWYGEGYKIADYDWVCYDGNHTWTHTNVLSVSPPSLPGFAGAISGPTNIYQGQNSVVYTVPAIAYATSYVWTLPPGATGTSTTNSITVNYGSSAVSGDITVTGQNSCGDGTTSSLAITVNLTGITLTENNKTIKVYPNPVTNELIIEIEGNNEKVSFEISNSFGQIIFKGTLLEKTIIQTTTFSPGVYFIKLENGKTIEFKKIVKH